MNSVSRSHWGVNTLALCIGLFLVVFLIVPVVTVVFVARGQVFFNNTVKVLQRPYVVKEFVHFVTIDPYPLKIIGKLEISKAIIRR